MRKMFLFFFILISTSVIGQSGLNDPTFNTFDNGLFGDGSGCDGVVNTSIIQTDGKIIIGGGFTSYHGASIKGLARLNIDGSRDVGFNPGDGANSWVFSTAMQPDEKIIAVGDFTSFNGLSINRVVRLNSDGSLDPTFNLGMGANIEVRIVALQSDEKIIIGGSFTSYNGITINRIARLNNDGSLDASFNPGIGPNNSIYTIAIQPDGKIIIGGDFTSYNGVSTNHVARLNADGSLDASFNPGTSANNTVLATAIQSDGKIVIAGFFTSFNGAARNYIARLNANGSLDATFNPGFGADNNVWTTALQPDGKIIIGGDFTSFNGVPINRIARLNSNGTLDSFFNPGTGTNNSIFTSVLQPDGKLIIAGDFSFYNDNSRNRIARVLNCIQNEGTDVQIACSSYTWIDGNTYTSSTTTPTYVLTNAAGCDSIVTLNLTIPPLPALTITSNAPVCNGEELSLEAGPAGMTSYAWTGPNGFISTQQVDEITNATPSASGLYELTITDANGCSNTTSASLVVQPTPTADIPTSQLVCNGFSTSEVAFSGTVAGTSFEWTNSNVSIGLPSSGIGNISSFIGTNEGTIPEEGIITVIPSANSCLGESINFTITINPTPIIFSGNDQTICSGETITLSGGGAVSYMWDNGVVNTTPFSPTLTTTYTVTGTDGNGCQNSDDVTITVLTPPTQDVCVVTVDEITANYNVIFWEKPGDIGNIDSFYVYREITLNDYQLIGAVAVDELSIFEDFGANPNTTNYKYKIAVLDTCGNESDLSLYHNSIHLQYLGLGNFQWTPYAIENTPNQVASYNFYRDDNGTGNFQLLNVVSGGNQTYTDVNYAAFPSALYRVDVNWLNGNECTATRANINTSRSNTKGTVAAPVDGLLELYGSMVQLYPNPATQVTQLQLPTQLVGSTVTLTNAVGQVMTTLVATNTTLELDLGTYANGLYVVKIATNSGVITKKLVKE